MAALNLKPIPNSRGILIRDFSLNHIACAENWHKVRNQFQTFNVLDYGADPTGARDSYAALNRASTAAGLVGGTVIGPMGTYLISQPWILPSGVGLKGFGNATVFKAMAGFLGDGYRGVITVDVGSSHVPLADFKVDGNRSAQDQTLAISDYSNISLLSCSNVSGHNIESVNGCGRNTGSGGDGLYIAERAGGGPCTNIHFTFSRFGSNYRNACSVIYAKHFSFKSCRFYSSVGTNPGAGFDFEPNNNTQSIDDGLLEGCEFYSNGGRGIQVYNGVAITSITNVIVRGGKVYNNGSNGYGINGEQADRAIVLDGVEFTNNGADEVQIGKSFGTSVLGCYIHDSSYNGIVLEHNTGSRTDINNFEISGNTIRTIGKNGIYLGYNAGGQNGRIFGNKITNCSNGSAGTYFPINFNVSGSVNFNYQIFGNIIRSDAQFAGSGYMTYGINIPAGVQKLQVYLNTCDGMTTGAVSNAGSSNFIQFNWYNAALSDSFAQNSVGLGPTLFNGDVVIGGTNGETLAVNRANGASNIQLRDGSNVAHLVLYRNNTGGSEWIVVHTNSNTGNKAKIKYRASLAGNETLELDLATQIAKYSGRAEHLRGSDVASANDLTLGVGNSFGVTGSTNVNGIATANWQAGSVVKLFLLGGITIKHNTAPSAGFAKFSLQGAADFVGTSGAVLTVEYDGTAWQEIARRTA